MLDSLVTHRHVVDHCYNDFAPEKYRDRAPTALEWDVISAYRALLDYHASVVVKAEHKGHWSLSQASDNFSLSRFAMIYVLSSVSIHT